MAEGRRPAAGAAMLMVLLVSAAMGVAHLASQGPDGADQNPLASRADASEPVPGTPPGDEPSPTPLWPSLPVRGGDPVFQFSVRQIDGTRRGGEPVVSIGADGTIWVAGTSSESHLWRRLQHGWTWEDPTTTGGHDAAVLVAGSGRVHYVELEAPFQCNPGHMQVAYRDGGWSQAITLPQHDRPWLQEHGGTLYLLATAATDCGVLQGLVFFTSNDGGVSWSGPTTIKSGNVYGHNFAIRGDGRFLVPYWDHGAGELRVTTSTSLGGPWPSELVAAGVNHGSHPMSAIDAAGNFYVAWREDVALAGGGVLGQVKYRTRLANGDWLGERVVAEHLLKPTFGTAAAAGAAGKLDVAWHVREAGDTWKLMFAQVTGADTATPTIGVPVEVATAASPLTSLGTQLLDYFTMARDTNGNAVIAFGCFGLPPAGGGAPPAWCTNDEVLHPAIAIQTAGPTV